MILLAIEDITDLVTTNELLTKKNLELQKYNDQLEAFSSAASHDLQEPLRKIQMFSNRIINHETNLSESTLHNLNRISVASTSMSQLITDLIDYSRINFIEKEYKQTDLNVLLKKIIADLKDIIVERNATVTISNLPQLNVIPYQIQQLFTNLIMNSIKYTKDGIAPEIKIESERATSEEIIKIGGNPEIQYTKICVIDNGIGFNKEYENKIFEPFFRLHSNDQYTGSGLGLTISKKIVSNHHGFITTASKINHGTTFSIYFPL
jgi:two-component system CheB/CheR fusion protein